VISDLLNAAISLICSHLSDHSSSSNEIFCSVVQQIGMINDHDECEWVNVSSGTGLPGLYRTKSKEP